MPFARPPEWSWRPDPGNQRLGLTPESGFAPAKCLIGEARPAVRVTRGRPPCRHSWAPLWAPGPRAIIDHEGKLRATCSPRAPSRGGRDDAHVRGRRVGVQAADDSGRESLRPLGRRHRAACGPGRRGARAPERGPGRAGDGEAVRVRPLPDPAEGRGPDGRAPGGPRADHQPRGGQGHRRGPARGEPGRGDDDGLRRGGQADPRRDHPGRRRAGRRRQARLHPPGAVRRGAGHHPVQLPAEPRVPQGRARRSRAATPSS